MGFKTKKKIAVLRGGASHHYNASLKTGAYVIKNLPEKFEVFDCLIDKEGTWHLRGIPKRPESIFQHVDLVWNALHGEFGEDGKLQTILQSHSIPHTGSSVMPSVFGLNKHFSKNIFRNYGIKTPVYFLVSKDGFSEEVVNEIFRSIPLPFVVKPISGGLSLGVSVVSTPFELKKSIEHAFSFGEKALVEEYINGREVTVGVIDNFRDEKFYTLPPMEIRKDEYGIFHHDMKSFGYPEYSHQSLTPMEKTEAKRIAILAHKAIGARHYSNADMIIHPKRGMYLLEVNTQPGLYENSPFTAPFEVVGIKPEHFLEHVINNI